MVHQRPVLWTVFGQLLRVTVEPTGFNHSIVCIHSRGVELRPGTMLACKAESGAWYSLMVETVQIDGKPVQCSPKGQDVKVGLKTDGRCKIAHTVYSVS